MLFDERMKVRKALLRKINAGSDSVEDSVHEILKHLVHVRNSPEVLRMARVVDFHGKIWVEHQTLRCRLEAVKHV